MPAQNRKQNNNKLTLTGNQFHVFSNCHQNLKQLNTHLCQPLFSIPTRSVLAIKKTLVPFLITSSNWPSTSDNASNAYRQNNFAVASGKVFCSVGKNCKVLHPISQNWLLNWQSYWPGWMLKKTELRERYSILGRVKRPHPSFILRF